MRTNTTNETYTRKTRALLWTIPGVLALLFLFAGGMKLAAPAAALAQQSPLPDWCASAAASRRSRARAW